MRVLQPWSAWHGRHPAPTLSSFKRAGAHLWASSGLELRIPSLHDTGSIALGYVGDIFWWVIDARGRRRGVQVPVSGTVLSLVTRAGAVGDVRIVSVWARPSGASGYLVYDRESVGVRAVRQRLEKRGIKRIGHEVVME